MATGTGSIIISDSRSQDEKINESYNAAKNVNLWFTFDEEKGLITRKKGSPWSTRIDANGYYIDYDDISTYVAAFHKELLEVHNIQVGNIVVRSTSNGGWVWTDS